MILKVALIILSLGLLLEEVDLEQKVALLNQHVNVCAKAINAEQYQIDVIVKSLKDKK